jgi:hypothetical protein
VPPAPRIERRTLARGLAALVIAGSVAIGLGSAAAAQTPPGSTLPPTTTGPPLATSPPITTPPTSVPADTSGRQWLVPVPIGCEVPALPDVVFVGTLVQTGTPSGSPQTSLPGSRMAP